MRLPLIQGELIIRAGRNRTLEFNAFDRRLTEDGAGMMIEVRDDASGEMITAYMGPDQCIELRDFLNRNFPAEVKE